MKFVSKIKKQYKKRSSFQKGVINITLTVAVALLIVYLSPYSAELATPVYYIGDYIFGESMANVYAYNYVSMGLLIAINALAIFMVTRVFMRNWTKIIKNN